MRGGRRAKDSKTWFSATIVLFKRLPRRGVVMIAGAPQEGLSPVMIQKEFSRKTPGGWFTRPSWRRMRSQGVWVLRFSRKGFTSALPKEQAFQDQMARFFPPQQGGRRDLILWMLEKHARFTWGSGAAGP